MQQAHGISPLKRTLAWPIIKRAILVALVIGSLLNVINQGDAVWTDTPLDWTKLTLTFCVPFFVSLYGAFTANQALATA